MPWCNCNSDPVNEFHVCLPDGDAERTVDGATGISIRQCPNVTRKIENKNDNYGTKKKVQQTTVAVWVAVSVCMTCDAVFDHPFNYIKYMKNHCCMNRHNNKKKWCINDCCYCAVVWIVFGIWKWVCDNECVSQRSLFIHTLLFLLCRIVGSCVRTTCNCHPHTQPIKQSKQARQS